MTRAPDPDADRLYSLPLAEFTAARDALAARRRAAGDLQGAAAVKALRKPSVPVWAVNRAALAHPGDFAALLEAGATLQRAHAAVVAGDPPAVLRDATAAERAARNAVAAHAAAALEAAGLARSPATLERIASTLEALATDPEAHAAAARGALDHELRRAGFGAVAPSAAADEPPFGAKAGATGARGPSAAEATRARREARLREIAQRRVADLERAAEGAEREAERLTRAAQEARERARAARAEADRLRG